MEEPKTEVAVVEESKKTITFSSKPDDLNEKQEYFCELYATHQDYFGNGVQSYIEVYDIDKTKPNWYNTACVCASQLLSNPKVTDRINELMIECGLNDVAVDNQLAFLITQHENKIVKLGAIKEYNVLRGRIIKKQEHSFKPLPPEMAILGNMRKVQAEEILTDKIPTENIVDTIVDATATEEKLAEEIINEDSNV